MYDSFADELEKIRFYSIDITPVELKKEAVIQDIKAGIAGAKHLLRMGRAAKPAVQQAGQKAYRTVQTTAAKATPTVNEWTKNITQSGVDLPWWGAMAGTANVLPRSVSTGATLLSMGIPLAAKAAPHVGRVASQGTRRLGKVMAMQATKNPATVSLGGRF